MPTDPRLAFAGTVGDPLAVAFRRIGALEERIATIERNRPAVQAGAGAPTTAPRDGTLYVDTSAPALYVRAAGAWKSVAVG